jgi:hypothetical protein
MSARLVAAAAANIPDPEKGTVEPPFPQAALVREAIAALGWGTMTYACDECGFEWEVWLALGVEGPPPLRDAGLYVPSPFSAGRCPAWPLKPGATAEDRATFTHLAACDGRMTHVRWGDDREFDPALTPDDAPRFVIDAWHNCAQLVIPEPARIRAGRFHHENGR